MKNKVSVIWFRRDLRLEDNVRLYQALASKFPVGIYQKMDFRIRNRCLSQQIAEHSFVRERALKVFGEAVRENNQ